tara:strand:+ start:178 stop:492 length:315 start_codon:yes stop_codon:yes gene_type:complete
MYKIYYTQTGDITMVGSSDDPGTYITCDLETLQKLQGNTYLYRIENRQLVKKIIEQTKPSRSFKIVDGAPGYICARDNLFEVIEYANEKPIWFDANTHSWVRYD